MFEVDPERERLDKITEEIIGAAISVHRELGPGLLESAYEGCLCHELSLRGLKFERQVPLPVSYKGVKLDCGYFMDLVGGTRSNCRDQSCRATHTGSRSSVAVLFEVV